jgi:hypothetical protein
MKLVHVDMRKWRNHAHWQFDARLLGEDEHASGYTSLPTRL